MSTRILILKDGVIKPASSSDNLGLGGLVLGTTSSTAYRGDYGNIAYLHSQSTGNPHGTTKTDIGLGNLVNSLQLVASNNLSDLVNRQTALNNISGTQTANRVLRSDGTNILLSQVSLTTDVINTLPVSLGGTGQTTIQSTINSLAGGVTSGSYLRGNGTNIVLSTIQASDIPTLNQNTTGTASNVTGIIAIANGGTNAITQQSALNNLAGAVTANRVLKGNGTNIVLSQVDLNSSDIINTLPIANGGTGSNTQNFVDLTNTQTIQGAKTFSGSPIIITAATTGTGGTGSVLKVVQTGNWSVNSPYVLEVIGYSYLDGFRITGQGGARGIYQIGNTLQLDFATNNGDITFTSGTTGTVERLRLKNSDGSAAFTSTTVSTSTTTGGATFLGGVGIAGAVYSGGVIQGTSFQVSGTKVIGARETGWTAGTGTPNKSTFAADTATLIQTAQRTLAIEQALRNHGLIN